MGLGLRDCTDSAERLLIGIRGAEGLCMLSHWLRCFALSSDIFRCTDTASRQI